MQPPRFSNEDKVSSLNREIALRKVVYSKKVEDGTMSRFAAQREIAIFEEIRDEYQARYQRRMDL